VGRTRGRENSFPSRLSVVGMTSPGIYWRTLKHLQARQIIWRMIFRLSAPVPSVRTSVPLRPLAIPLLPFPARASSMVSARGFLFLNEEHQLDDVGWDSSELGKLWRYNLHYFDDVNAQGADSRRVWHRDLVASWILENPPAAGTGWEPYPVSQRVVNWIKWFATEGQVPDVWLASLATQVRWLSRRLEWHLLGNHLFLNAKALCLAGMYFAGPEADKWRDAGVRILLQELPEQILADGGQFERSPMYHLLALEDVLDLLNMIRAYGELDFHLTALRKELTRRVGPMLAWAQTMQHPDGGLPRFNDSAEGVAPSLAQLGRLAQSLGIGRFTAASTPLEVLSESGYIRMTWDDACALLDVAPVGPDYLAGHGHADTLSFELSIAGRQVVVNRGTSCYGISIRRDHERGTAAHSTVEVAGRNSSEVWAGFRVGRRAHPTGLEIDASGVRCAHDGYHFLPGRVEHRRTWTRQRRGLDVRDSVIPASPAVARFHLAPGLIAVEGGSCIWRVVEDGRTLAQVTLEGGKVRLLRTQHAISFGRLITADTLEMDLSNGQCISRWRW
jgi:uncharacterized heparinase superfamily protein